MQVVQLQLKLNFKTKKEYNKQSYRHINRKNTQQEELEKHVIIYKRSKNIVLINK